MLKNVQNLRIEEQRKMIKNRVEWKAVKNCRWAEKNPKPEELQTGFNSDSM